MPCPADRRRRPRRAAAIAVPAAADCCVVTMLNAGHQTPQRRSGHHCRMHPADRHHFSPRSPQALRRQARAGERRHRDDRRARSKRLEPDTESAPMRHHSDSAHAAVTARPTQNRGSVLIQTTATAPHACIWPAGRREADPVDQSAPGFVTATMTADDAAFTHVAAVRRHRVMFERNGISNVGFHPIGTPRRGRSRRSAMGGRLLALRRSHHADIAEPDSGVKIALLRQPISTMKWGDAISRETEAVPNHHCVAAAGRIRPPRPITRRRATWPDKKVKPSGRPMTRPHLDEVPVAISTSPCYRRGIQITRPAA